MGNEGETQVDAPFDEARYAGIVGKRAERYLARFRRFAQRGEWLSWNWAAFFGTFAWLRYRRLYRWSWLYFFVSTPMLMFWALLPTAADSCAAALNPATPFYEYAIEALIAAGWIVPPLFADRLYFNEVRGLATKGEIPRPRGFGTIAGALAVQVLVVFGLMTSTAGYGGYTYRARVSEGVLAASSARTAVQEYLSEHHRLPGRLEEVHEASGNDLVSKLELVGRGTIRATFSERAGRLAGHTISAVPAWKDNEIVSWICRSEDLPRACVPHMCRQPQ